jgi:uncharacterized protein (DUF2252 family)
MVDTTEHQPASGVALQSRRVAKPSELQVLRPSRAERIAAGKAARSKAALESHAQFDAAVGRDPVSLLAGQAESRVPELVPVRHGRMLVSPFTYYRGAALPMASDLATTPTSGLQVQLCGDAHLANFGAFASPERKLVFDVNDFDETLPGPFEWDIKRLAASMVVAARDNGFTRKEGRTAVLASVSGYRVAMRALAKQPMMAVWYAHVEIDEAIRGLKSQLDPTRFKATEAMVAKAHTRDSTQALSKLTTIVDGRRQIISTPPLIVPVEELFPLMQSDEIYRQLGDLINRYASTLQSDRQHLLQEFELVQVARKVVGVGSVGTRAWIILMDGGDGVEPLFLQAKEAQRSVLSEFAGRSKYDNEGQRVVAGQHLMQASSDIFLGWQRAPGQDGVDRDYYVRQLRDWKFSLPLEQMLPAGMSLYGGLCGSTLARAHARSGDRIAIAAYLGKSDRFDNAVVDFAETYADQNERDHAALAQAVASGRLDAARDT